MDHILRRAIHKAGRSPCHFKIAAIGLDKNGRYLGMAFNYPRFSRLGGGVHAEVHLLAKYGLRVRTIIICRTNKTGGILPIHPCVTCERLLGKLRITWRTLSK